MIGIDDLKFRIKNEKDGKYYLYSFDRIKQFLGICKLEKEVKDLDSRISNLERPLCQKRILDLLKTQLKPRTFEWIKNRIYYPKPTKYDMCILFNEGRIKEIRLANNHIGYQYRYGFEESGTGDLDE